MPACFFCWSVYTLWKFEIESRMTLFQIYYADTSKIKGAEVKTSREPLLLTLASFFINNARDRAIEI